MTKQELLKEYYEREMNNVFVCSANYLMDFPKKGYEKEWREAKEKAELIMKLIEEVS